MPPSRENPLRAFARAVERDDALTFGTPWVADGGSAVLVPVLRAKTSARGYVLADEVRRGLVASDTGRIDRISVDNTTGSWVFLRPGVLFHAKETASRGTLGGTVLEPHRRTDVEVRCIHASATVARGSALEIADIAPPQAVYRALVARDQGGIWASIGEFLAGPRGPEDRAAERPVSDDLLDGQEGNGEADVITADIPRQARSLEGQCGVLVLDGRGLLAAEIFDDPRSWAAAGDAILQRLGPLLAPHSRSPFRLLPDPRATTGSVKEFLGALERTPEHWLAEGTRMSDDLLVQYTSLGGKVIHVSASRHEDTRWPPGHGSADRTNVPEPASVAGAEDAFASPHGSATTQPEADGDVLATATTQVGWDEVESAPPGPREKRRKVLTSGWDGATFQALERYAAKECSGDRSSAVRFLVRQGLRKRGYMGPLPMPNAGPSWPALTETASAPTVELEQRHEEARVLDLVRIADEGGYAVWLRERARAELRRVASTSDDEVLRATAQSALDRLRPMAPAPEPPAPEPMEPVEPPEPAPRVDVRILLRKALEASGTGKYPQALALFDEILRHEPANRTALLGRAVALRRAGRAQEALEGLDRVLRIEPENVAALLNRGRILHERGELAGALEAFDRLVDVAPNDWDVWMARGDVLMRLGRPREALASFKEALRRNPDDEKLQRKSEAAELATRPARVKASEPGPLPFGVEEGQSYLVVEHNPGTSYRVLRSLAERQLPSLVITRQPPGRVRHEHDIAGARVIGLSHTIGPDLHDPTALASLARVIERFVEENHGRGVVLLEGLNRLIADNGFRDTILFVEHVNEVVLQRSAVFLVSVNPEGLAERELALLERTLKLLTEGLDLG